MVQKINGNSEARIFALDIRNRNDEESIRQNVSSIWLATIADNNSYPDDKDIFCHSTIELVNRIESMANEENEGTKNVCFYVFDLGFIFSFIFPILKERGFYQSKTINRGCENCFSVFGNETMSNVFSLTIKFSKKSGIVFFKDIGQMYSGFNTLEAFSNAFGLNRGFVQDDYDRIRPEGYEPDALEIANAYSRVMSIVDVVFAMKDEPAFFQSYTLASYAFRDMLRTTFAWAKTPYLVYRSKKLYPQIDGEEEEALRASVFGGLCGPSIYLHGKKEVNKPIFSIDEKQAYASRMALSVLPCGSGVHYDGEKVSHGNSFSLYKVKFLSWDYVDFQSIPYFAQNCITFLLEPVELWIWDFELAEALMNYGNLKFEILETWQYKGKHSPFKRYFESQLKKRKESEKAVMQYHYKRKLNAILGKTIQKTKEYDFEAIENEDGQLTGKGKKREETKPASYAYLPLGSCVIALNRVIECEMARRFGYKNVVYMDTDSLFVLDKPETRKVLSEIEKEGKIGNEFGCWQIEKEMTKGEFPMAKRYKYELKDGNVVAKGSGVRFDNLEETDYTDLKITDTEICMRVKRKCKNGTLFVMEKRNLK